MAMGNINLSAESNVKLNFELETGNTLFKQFLTGLTSYRGVQNVFNTLGLICGSVYFMFW